MCKKRERESVCVCDCERHTNPYDTSNNPWPATDIHPRSCLRLPLYRIGSERPGVCIRLPSERQRTVKQRVETSVSSEQQPARSNQREATSEKHPA